MTYIINKKNPKFVSAYVYSKKTLKQIADEYKNKYPSDKPKVRQIINDSIDCIVSDFKLTNHQRSLLCNYACKLHPKD